MQYLKPINILDARPYRPERMAVVDAVGDVFVAAGLGMVPPLHDYGCWRHPRATDAQGYLVPFLSVTWYIEQAREPSRRRVNAQRVMAAFRQEPWRNDDSLGDHYDLLLMDDPMFDPAEQQHFGLPTTPSYSVPGIGIVLSTAGLDDLGRVSYSLLKTLAMREVLHAFGVPGIRREALALTPRVACTNPCVLGPCIDVPRDLERLTDRRLAGPPLCDLCLAELRANLAADQADDPNV